MDITDDDWLVGSTGLFMLNQKIGGFLKWGYHKMDWLLWKIRK
jgi:hypothetical protein